MCLCVHLHSGCNWLLLPVFNNVVITSLAALPTSDYSVDIPKEIIVVNYVIVTTKFSEFVEVTVL